MRRSSFFGGGLGFLPRLFGAGVASTAVVDLSGADTVAEDCVSSLAVAETGAEATVEGTVASHKLDNVSDGISFASGTGFDSSSEETTV